jgi:Rps23 Pro-64 3,4-dihydroxylase Tpa1-like proline 4-hydroxylase
MKRFLPHSAEYIIIDDYPRQSFLKDELCKTIENMEDVQGRQTVVKAKMSHWSIDSNEISKLKTFIIENNSLYPFISFEISDINIWANCYRKGDYTVSHDHLPALLSIAYFLKSKRYFSPLVFEGTWRKIKIKPKEGRLVIFPSYFKHNVPIHKLNDARITLSGNLNVPSDGAPYSVK